MHVTPQIHMHAFKKMVPFPMQQFGINLMMTKENEYHTIISLNIGLVDWLISAGFVFCTHVGKDSVPPIKPPNVHT
jgi:hypothetical protein